MIRCYAVVFTGQGKGKIYYTYLLRRIYVLLAGVPRGHITIPV